MNSVKGKSFDSKGKGQRPPERVENMNKNNYKNGSAIYNNNGSSATSKSYGSSATSKFNSSSATGKNNFNYLNQSQPSKGSSASTSYDAEGPRVVIIPFSITILVHRN